MKIFVAGATGAVGSALVPILRQRGFEVVPHVRPQTAARHPLGKDPQAVIGELSQIKTDAEVIVCLAGTMRRRFAAGDTYESSDYQPVVDLIANAKPGAYFVLLSSLGARKGRGYLGWKHKAEEVVRGSGLQHAIVRPSMLDSTRANSQASDGTQRKPPPLFGTLSNVMRAVPGLKAVADDVRPMPVEVLCAAIARLIETRATGTLTGRNLWALQGGEAGSAQPGVP